MTRAHITALALILAVGTWNPPTLVRADRAAVDGPPPRRPPTRQELAEIVPVETSRARSVATPEIGPASLKTITRLAFQSFRDNNYEIYIADGDASNETRITNNSAADISPRLNHGADRIAFASKRDGNYEIYTVSVTGSELKRLTNSAAEDSDPFWSPDGTRILFTSNRDSNYEIYVMNADGSGQTRLTSNSSVDVDPAWSPDGSTIVFVSDRGAPANTGGRLWLMNANGSNQRQIDTTSWSGNPQFSPDGSKIGFNADTDGDYWLDLVWMPSGGGAKTTVFWGSSYWGYDQYMGSWSPNGQYLSVATAAYAICGNQLCLSQLVTYFVAPFSADLTGYRLTSTVYDVFTDWNWADRTPPTTAVQALPAESPADFTVTWTGSATDGPAQQFNYEVQTREGLTGTWTSFATAAWNAGNTKAFHGLGGRTYYFRSRGIDNATNVEAWPADADAWTTIEALPPVSSMAPLDPFTRTTTLALQWSGTDPGGSGIAGYDLEYRIGDAGAWTRHLTRTLSTSTAFPVARGNTYAFRARAVDAAGNIEEWPAAAGDTQSTIYTWRGGGHVFDIRGAPIESAVVALQRGGTPAFSDTDGAGAYVTVLVTSTPTLSVTWSKAAFGNLPVTPFSVSTDLTFDAYLPPVDNIVDAPDFETASLTETAWIARGLPSAQLITEAAHTGLRSIALGGLLPTSPINLSNTSGDSREGHMAVDPAGAPHLVWLERTAAREDVVHTERLPSGAWSAPEILSAGIVTNTAGDPAGDKPVIGFDPLGTAHVVWRISPQGEAYYVTRPAGGGWSAPLMIASGLNPANSSALRLAVSAAGRVHVAWHSATAGRSDIYYRGRDAAGVWGPLQNVTGGDPFATEAAYPEIAVDAVETAHLAWQNGIGYYASRPVSGSWSTPFGVTVWPFLLEQTRLSVDLAGQARAAWLGHAQGVNAIVYATIEGGFSTSTQLAYTSTQALTLTRLLIDGSGQSQLGWSRGDGEVLHGSAGPGGWTSANVSASPSKTSSQMDLLSTTSGLWAVWREQEGANTFAVACKKRTLDGQWHVLNACVNAAAGLGNPALAVGPNNRAHLAFGTPGMSAGEQYYANWDDAGPRGAGLAQTVDITSAMAGPVLSFLYRLDVPAGENTPAMTVSLEGASGSTAVFTAAASTNAAWTHVWRDVSAWSGQAVTLTFQLDPVSGVGRARLLLDEVNLGSIPADTWLTAQTVGQAPPGGQIVIEAVYGNHGTGVAPGAVLTATLPDGLTFVSADPAPNSTSPLLWQLPDMAPGAGPFTIQITATIAPEQPLLAPMTVTLGLDTQAVELDLVNNQAVAAIWVGYRTFVPLVTSN